MIMTLTNFSVSNFRSITKAHKIQMSNMTVLIGKNNEGKSNILLALSLAMDVMKAYTGNPRMLNRSLKGQYIWERDYPISLQENSPNGYSLIDLTFALTPKELQDFKAHTGITLNSYLPVRVLISRNEVKIDIPKRGTPAFSDYEKKLKTIEFVCQKIDFNFIPAVRTERDAIQVINSLIAKELSVLETTKEYADAITTIEDLQQRILNDIANKITNPLKTFIPSVKETQLHIQKEQRRNAYNRNIEVIIDDGTLTSIQQKGGWDKKLNCTCYA